MLVWVRPAMLKYRQLCRKTCYGCQMSLLLASPTQAHLPTSAESCPADLRAGIFWAPPLPVTQVHAQAVSAFIT